jgi:hypothetical protein
MHACQDEVCAYMDAMYANQDVFRASQDAMGAHEDPMRALHEALSAIYNPMFASKGTMCASCDSPHALKHSCRANRTAWLQTEAGSPSAPEHAMRQDQQRQLDALRRVQAFLDMNAGEVGALNSAEGRELLDDAISRIDTLGNEQAVANLEMRGQLNREKALAWALRMSHMRPITTFARARLRDVPDYAALIRSDRLLRPNQLVHAARALAAAAAPHADALTRAGFPADTVAQLAAAAEAVNDALEERANTKVGRVGATKGIEESLRQGREAAAILHAVISKQFAENTTFLVGWHAARRVMAKTSVTRHSAPASVGNLEEPDVVASS